MKTTNTETKEQIQQVAKRLLGAWVMSILACFIALRLGAYLGAYGFLGLMLLIVPAFALYQGWKPWLRYIFYGE
jgi:hypothetical protein